RSERTRAATRDALADVLRRLGDLTPEEAQDRVLAGLDAAAMLAALERDRRAVRVRVGGEERWIAADDAGLYRDAFGAVPPSGLPEPFTADVDRPLERVLSRYARTHGPFTTGEVRARYGVDATSALAALERDGDLVRGELRARLAQAPCFFTDFLAELPLAPEEIQEALWDLAWAGEVTNDAFAPLRAPRLTLARAQRSTLERRGRAGTRFGARRGTGARAQ